jgi:glutamine cyclotransferase
MKRLSIGASLLIAAFTLVVACGGNAVNTRGGPAPGTTPGTGGPPLSQSPVVDDSSSSGGVPTYTYDLVNRWPHDPTAFTQGLVFYDGALVESEGLYGHSSLRKVDLQTGKILKKADVPHKYFAEGLTVFQEKIFQLTWREDVCFVYDPHTFTLTSLLAYTGEGWGLTHDDQYLILSDGTNRLKFLDPVSLRVVRTISVYDGDRSLTDLNELEFIKGEIYANIWHTDRIVRIDPNSGRILGWIDLAGLLPASERSDEEAVLNGIAYDEAHDRLFVTGKLWPAIFEIRLKRK